LERIKIMAPSYMMNAWKEKSYGFGLLAAANQQLGWRTRIFAIQWSGFGQRNGQTDNQQQIFKYKILLNKILLRNNEQNFTGHYISCNYP
jgi:hypothetical protein